MQRTQMSLKTNYIALIKKLHNGPYSVIGDRHKRKEGIKKGVITSIMRRNYTKSPALATGLDTTSVDSQAVYDLFSAIFTMTAAVYSPCKASVSA